MNTLTTCLTWGRSRKPCTDNQYPSGDLIQDPHRFQDFYATTCVLTFKEKLLSQLVAFHCVKYQIILKTYRYFFHTNVLLQT